MTDVNINFRSLRDMIVTQEADTPLVIRAVTPSVPRGQWSTEGPMNNQAKVNTYVHLEALPKELQERVRMAIEALNWG